MYLTSIRVEAEPTHRWPFIASYQDVPPVHEAVDLALELRGEWKERLGYQPQPEDIVRELGWPVVTECLGRSVSETEALLAPLLSGGFVVIVDPRELSGAECREANTDSRQFRIGHELAHILFWVPGTPPRRLTRYSASEEEFCDSFATAFLAA